MPPWRAIIRGLLFDDVEAAEGRLWRPVTTLSSESGILKGCILGNGVDRWDGQDKITTRSCRTASTSYGGKEFSFDASSTCGSAEIREIRVPIGTKIRLVSGQHAWQHGSYNSMGCGSKTLAILPAQIVSKW